MPQKKQLFLCVIVLIFLLINSISISLAHGKAREVYLNEINLPEIYKQLMEEIKPSLENITKRELPSLSDDVNYRQIDTLVYSEFMFKLNLSIDPFFRMKHLKIIFNELDATQREAFLDIIEKIVEIAQKDVDDQGHSRKSVKEILPLISKHAELIALIGSMEIEITSLKALHKNALRFADSKHVIANAQTYSGATYDFHYKYVRNVLIRFGFGYLDSFLGLQLGTAAILHDIIEDAGTKEFFLKRIYGDLIGTTVLNVSNVVPPENETWTIERIKLTTLERTASTRESRILKLADRIANVEHGLWLIFNGHKSKILKYIKEYPGFRKALFVAGEADEMWLHLDKLLLDFTYARETILSSKERYLLVSREKMMRPLSDNLCAKVVNN